MDGSRARPSGSWRLLLGVDDDAVRQQGVAVACGERDRGVRVVVGSGRAGAQACDATSRVEFPALPGRPDRPRDETSRRDPVGGRT